MKNQIVIHGTGKQTRIALLENGELAQLFIEAPENQRTVGDIYVAQVHKVMSGIRAAFIDMGTPKDAFLHFSDVGDNLEDYIEMLNGKGTVEKAEAHNKRLNRRYGNQKNRRDNNLSPGVQKQMRAGDVLVPGQKLLVQIVKEPIGSKGPRVSTDITLAGRFVVLIPKGDYVAVSKRIRSYKERRRLKNLVSDELPEGFGVIVRTVAKGQPDEALKQDIKEVLTKWKKVLEDLKTAKPPQLLYRDMDMTDSLIRDLFAKDYNNVLIDDPKIHKQIKTYIGKVAPQMAPSIKLYKGKEHIFEHMNISQDVESVFSPRVKMPSGGYLIFEQTEAMYVVDVNSGRYAAKRHQEENSLKTNLEAARGVAKQLRLRDIGGIIVVDFIDLKSDTNRKKVYDELKKEFKKDKAKTNVLPMSDFGLVQITRQRIRPSVVNSVSRVCPMCGGSGNVVSSNTIIADIEAWLSKFAHSHKQYRQLDLYINPFLRSYLTRGLFSQRMKWMFKYKLRLNVIAEDTVSMNDYKFTITGNDADITEAVLHDKPIETILKENEEEISRLESTTKVDSKDLDVEKRPRKSSPTKNNDNGNGNRRSKDNLPDAFDVAKNYALKHHIDIKPVKHSDDDQDVYEDEDDDKSKNGNQSSQKDSKDQKVSALSIAKKYANRNDIDPDENLIDSDSDSDSDSESDDQDDSDENQQKDDSDKAKQQQKSEKSDSNKNDEEQKQDKKETRAGAFDVAKSYANSHDIDPDEMLKLYREKQAQPDDHDDDPEAEEAVNDETDSANQDSEPQADEQKKDEPSDSVEQQETDSHEDSSTDEKKADVAPAQTEDGKPKVNDIKAETFTSKTHVVEGEEPQNMHGADETASETAQSDEDDQSPVATQDHDADTESDEETVAKTTESEVPDDADDKNESESKEEEDSAEVPDEVKSDDAAKTSEEQSSEESDDDDDYLISVESNIEFEETETPQVIEIEVHESSFSILKSKLEAKTPKQENSPEESPESDEKEKGNNGPAIRVSTTKKKKSKDN